MTSFASMSESKFIKKEDLNQTTGNLVYIKSFKKMKVGDDGEEAEYKWIVFFNEFEKGMVLNATNRAILERTYGDDTEDALGNPIVIYVDENISFGGKLVGGIRMRAPKGHKKPEPIPTRAAGVDEEDIPFN